MKKLIAVILCTMLLILTISGCARNTTVHYVDETTFEDVYYPANGSVVASGVTAVQIVINTPNIELGTGELAIFKADGTELVRYDARMDNNKVFIDTGKNPAFARLTIFLPEGQYFEMGESYYVTVDEKFFYVDDFHGFIDKIEAHEWEFTIADYGYNGNITEMPTTYLVGDTIEIPVALSEDAAFAVISYDNLAVVNSELRLISKSGTFELECLQAGSSVVSVTFLKADGTHLETLGFTVTVK